MRLIDFLCECREVIEADKEQEQKRASAPRPRLNHKPIRRRR